MTTKSGIAIFVSHSAEDVELATALVKFFADSLVVPTGAIRCTSVPGYTLPVGADSGEMLRDNIDECKVMVALITPASIRSTYVGAEMGAAWHARKLVCCVLSPNAKFEQIHGPFKGTHAIRVNDSPGMVSLLDSVASATSFEKREDVLKMAAVGNFGLAVAGIKFETTEAAPTPVEVAKAKAPLIDSDPRALLKLKAWAKTLVNDGDSFECDDIDRKLNLQSGMTAKHITEAAAEWYDVELQEGTFLLRTRPRGQAFVTSRGRPRGF